MQHWLCCMEQRNCCLYARDYFLQSFISSYTRAKTSSFSQYNHHLKVTGSREHMRLRSYDQLYKAVTHIIRISLFPCIDATDGVTIRKGRMVCVYRLQYREKTEGERLDLYTENTREIFDVFATLSHSEARHSCCCMCTWIVSLSTV